MANRKEGMYQCDIFGPENAKAALKFLFARSGRQNPWKNFRGLIGNTREKEIQLLNIINMHIENLDRVSYEHSSLLRDYFLERKSVDDIARNRCRAPQSIYRDIDRAVEILCDSLREFQPPFWHNIPPSLDSSHALITVLSKNIEDAYKLLSNGRTPVGILGKQGTRRSFIAAECARLVGSANLVDACFWVRNPANIVECREMVESAREKFVKNDAYLRLWNFLKIKGGNSRILVVFDDVSDGIHSEFIGEYIRILPNTWFALIVGLPHTQLMYKIMVQPLKKDQLKSFVYEACHEKGIGDDEITEPFLDEIVNKSDGWVSEAENIINAASRLGGKNRLDRALGESWFSIVNRTDANDNPDIDLLKIASLLPGGAKEEQYHLISGFPLVYVRERLSHLLSSALMDDDGWFALRSSRRQYFDNWQINIQSSLLNVYNYYANLKLNAPEGRALENHSKNLHTLSQKLLAYGKPREAVHLVVKDGIRFVERIFERDEVEAITFLDIIASAAEQVGKPEDEMLVKTLRGYFIIRRDRISDIVAEESSKIQSEATLLLESNVDMIVAQKLLRAILGAKCNIADHLRHQKRNNRALEIYYSSITDVDSLDDKLFKDMWFSRIAVTLLGLDTVEHVKTAIDILNNQILWAEKDCEWRRLAAAYHDLGEAKISYSKWSSDETQQEVLIDAINAFEKAVKWDTFMLRPRYVGRDYREMASAYFMLYKQVPLEEKDHYLQLARDALLEALPRLDKYNLINEKVLLLSKELGIDYAVLELGQNLERIYP